MIKGLIVLPIVLGTMLLIGGGAIVGVAIAHNHEQTQLVTNEHEISDSFTNINFDVETANIEFVVSTDGQTKVVCEEREKYPHEVEVKDDTLNIKFVDKVKWYEKVFNWSWKTEKITVYMPVAAYGNLNIECSTGAAKIKGDYTFENFYIKASTGALYLESDVTEQIDVKMSTGAVKFKGVASKNVNVVTSTGDINLEDVNVEEKLYIKASTGDATLKGVRAKNLEAKFSTGDMKLDDVLVEQKVDFKASTGKFTFSGFDCETLNCKTDTGDIRGAIINEHIIYAHSDTGRVDVPHCATGSVWNIESDTGRIIITIAQ